MRDVGVVMPVYNQEPSYLRTSLRSVLRQTYSDFTFVIVIDGADDKTVRTVREETSGDPRVKLLFHQQNQGVSKALNTGFGYLMTQPRIRYLTWVSSDNVYYPPFLETLRAKLHEGPSRLGFVYSSFRNVNEKGDCIHTPNLRWYQEKPKEELLDVCFVGTSFMYKKCYAEKIEGYHMEPVEDYEYWLRLMELCEIDYIPEELMDYRVNSAHSVSARLRNSIQQHRRWRYAFQLARHQARQRRNIPFETTVIFPVHDRIPNKVDLMETLLEQYYGNYKLLVIDISSRTTWAPVLKYIEDPRAAILTMPGATVESAVRRLLPNIGTPYVMIYGPRTAWPPLVVWDYLLKLVLYARWYIGEEFLSVRYSEVEKTILLKTSAEMEPVPGELYRIKSLLKVLKQN
ncbi:glycosyltransferase family 2 protein [Salinithrix halophila]|uniref:Glycosyltransferase family 2 protein n=1 Tax=Salinithrix halophila TaxID=1485204 RepID=A0ABV8JHG2_9BACL